MIFNTSYLYNIIFKTSYHLYILPYRGIQQPIVGTARHDGDEVVRAGAEDDLAAGIFIRLISGMDPTKGLPGLWMPCP
jgi:hypothetical protein